MRYRLEACSIKKGSKLHRGTIIMDIKGAPLIQFQKIKAVIENVSQVSSNYYPETLSKMFIINAPTLFTAVWKMIKGFLDERTASKVEILGSNYEKRLLEAIDAENLPTYLGGTCECANGCQNSDIGPWNDGTVKGYPIAFWEDMKIRDGL